LRVRAATLAAPRRVEIGEIDQRSPAAGEIRISVEGCGVCGSNLPVWEGRPWFEYPLAPGAPGHEGWGRVDEVGDGVDGLSAGDRVAMLCERALADSVVVAASDAVAVPRSIDGQPFPGEALGCAFNAAARSGFEAGQTVAVIGIGFMGAAIAQLAARAGARVVAISRRPFSLEIASAMGAAETLAMDDHQRLIGAVGELTGGEMCDVVVEAVGWQWPLDLAGELTRVRGRLVIAGFHQDGQRTVDVQLWNWRGIDVVNAHERDREIQLDGIRRAAASIDAGAFDPSALYTHTYPLHRLDEALDAMAERPDGFLKAVVTM
jgi:threonine dehydrogenase-like Zn-dependent dehydrogenase